MLDIPIENLPFEKSEHNVLDGKYRTLILCSYVVQIRVNILNQILENIKQFGNTAVSATIELAAKSVVNNIDVLEKPPK